MSSKVVLPVPMIKALGAKVCYLPLFNKGGALAGYALIIAGVASGAVGNGGVIPQGQPAVKKRLPQLIAYR